MIFIQSRSRMSDFCYILLPQQLRVWYLLIFYCVLTLIDVTDCVQNYDGFGSYNYQNINYNTHHQPSIIHAYSRKNAYNVLDESQLTPPADFDPFRPVQYPSLASSGFLNSVRTLPQSTSIFQTPSNYRVYGPSPTSYNYQSPHHPVVSPAVTQPPPVNQYPEPSLPLPYYTNDPQLAECEPGGVPKWDLLIMIDSSWSVGQVNFELIRDFLRATFGELPVGTNLALVQFSDWARTEFSFNYFQRANDALDHVNTMEYMGGGTRVGHALDYIIKEELQYAKGDRPNVPNAVVVITDGKSEDSITPGATYLRNQGVKMIAVGVTSAVDDAQLLQIAGIPTHIFKLPSFKFFNDSFKKTLLAQLCVRPFVRKLRKDYNPHGQFEKSNPTTFLPKKGSQYPKSYIYSPTIPRCRRWDVNVVFDGVAVPSHEFEHVRHFITSLMHQLPQSARLNFFNYKGNLEKNAEILLKDYGNKNDNVDSLQYVHYEPDYEVRLGGALGEVLYTTHTSNRKRTADAVLLITNGESFDDPGPAAEQLRQHGFKSIVIGIGQKVNPNDLNVIAGHVSRVYRLPYFHNLNYFDRRVVAEQFCVQEPANPVGGVQYGVLPVGGSLPVAETLPELINIAVPTNYVHGPAPVDFTNPADFSNPGHYTKPIDFTNPGDFTNPVDFTNPAPFKSPLPLAPVDFSAHTVELRTAAPVNDIQVENEVITEFPSQHRIISTPARRREPQLSSIGTLPPVFEQANLQNINSVVLPDSTLTHAGFGVRNINLPGTPLNITDDGSQFRPRTPEELGFGSNSNIGMIFIPAPTLRSKTPIIRPPQPQSIEITNPPMRQRIPRPAVREARFGKLMKRNEAGKKQGPPRPPVNIGTIRRLPTSLNITNHPRSTITRQFHGNFRTTPTQPAVKPSSSELQRSFITPVNPSFTNDFAAALRSHNSTTNALKLQPAQRPLPQNLTTGTQTSIGNESRQIIVINTIAPNFNLPNKPNKVPSPASKPPLLESEKNILPLSVPPPKRGGIFVLNGSKYQTLNGLPNTGRKFANETLNSKKNEVVVSLYPDLSKDHPFCCGWAANQECENNRKWMLKHCPGSCNAINGCRRLDCENKQLDCEDLAANGHCATRPHFMQYVCRSSCDACT